MSLSPMPIRSARDNSVADNSCVEFDFSASIVSDSRVHKYALILLWSGFLSPVSILALGLALSCLRYRLHSPM